LIIRDRITCRRKIESTSPGPRSGGLFVWQFQI